MSEATKAAKHLAAELQKLAVNLPDRGMETEERVELTTTYNGAKYRLHPLACSAYCKWRADRIVKGARYSNGFFSESLSRRPARKSQAPFSKKLAESFMADGECENLANYLSLYGL